MLVRPTHHSRVECLIQRHHALLSGMLANAWAKSHIHPLLVAAITQHDAPWRKPDAAPTFNPDSGLPYDFVDYPPDDKIDFYRDGLDELERVDPYIAYMVSLHYTTFSGTRDHEAFTRSERERRERLESRLAPALVSGAEKALEWLKFFDVFSLHLCLTGPETVASSIPPWLDDADAWSASPDGTDLQLRWAEETTLQVAPWPFDKAVLSFDLHYRDLGGRVDSAAEFDRAWEEAEPGRRTVELTPA